MWDNPASYQSLPVGGQKHGLSEDIETNRAICTFVSFRETGKRPDAGRSLFLEKQNRRENHVCF
jgi:hypothetical protein